MKIFIKDFTLFCALALIFIFIPNGFLFGQACDSSVPSFTLDLRGNADSTWVSPSVSRDGKCCGVKGSDRCIEFWVTLDDNAEAIRFFVASGAKPNGALFWQLNCGPQYPVGVDVCVTGPGPHRITFCKPGNNQNTYGVASISKPEISKPSIAANFCTGTLSAANFDPATIKWNTVSPGTRGQYNSYLSCTTGCDSIIVNYIDGLTYIEVEAEGVPVGGCSNLPVSVRSRVYFVDDKVVSIVPKHPTICFGGTYTQITAVGSGGAAPYTFTWSNGATGATINAPSVGWYKVTMQDTTNCPPVHDSVYVTAYMSPITASAGPDDTTCSNSPSLILNGTLQTATKGRWSGGAGIYSPNDSTLNATYTPTAAEITSGQVRHILTTIDNGSCPPVKDTMIQRILPGPIVNAGPDITVCGNKPQVALSGIVTNAGGGVWSGGSGTYFPNNTSLSTTYTPSATEIANKSINLTLTSSGNGKCLAASDQMLISITDAPTVEAGPDQTVCANNATVSLNAVYTVATGVTWSGGSGTWTNPNTATPTYTPSTSERTTGKVVLRVTTTGNGDCNPVSDSLTINITPAPTANAGPDINVCGNNPSVNLNGQVTITSTGEWLGGTGTFSSRTVLNPGYTPSAAEISAGFVNLVLRTTNNGNCLPLTDTVRINISPSPVATAGGPVTVCGNNAAVNLNGTVTVTGTGQWFGGSGTFSSGRNSLSGVYNPSAAEIAAGSAKLWLTSTNNNLCLPVTDTLRITINPAPTVSAGIPQSVCANNPVVNLNGSYTIAGGVQWSGGSGSFGNSVNPVTTYTPTATEISNGTVSLTLTTTGNGLCNPVSSSTTITITPAPIVDAGDNITICANNASATLSGTVSVASGGIWSGGTGTFSPSNTTLNATYTPSAGEITAGSVQLTLTSTGNGNCLSVSDQVTITINPAPTANAGPDQTVCANNPAVSLNGQVTITTTGAWSGGTGTFSPSAAALNATYTPSATEITNGFVDLTLTTTNNGLCSPVTDVMRINITPAPVVNAGLDQTVCANNSAVTLSGTVSVTGTGTWSGGGGTFNPGNTALNATYTPSAAEVSSGQVILRLTSTNNGNCLPVSDEIRITITPAPTVNAGVDRTVCANNPSLVLNGTVTVASGGTWSGGSGTFHPGNTTLNATYTPSASEISAGSVTLTLTTTGNGNCLAVSDQMVISITPAPVVNAGSDRSVCSNNPSLTLNGSVTVATGGTWSGGAGAFNPGTTTLNSNYTPTAAEIANGFVILTLTSTGNGNCNPVSDQMRIDFTTSPTVNAGPDQSLCSNNAVASLNGLVTVATGGTWSGGNGTFSSPNSLNTNYTPTATEISNGSVTLTLTTTGNGGCNPVNDQITLSFTPAPTANAGSDRTVCSNNPSLTLAGVVTVATGGTWSGGTGTFSDINSLTSNYTPSAAEIVAGRADLTLTTTGNGNCLAVSDQVRITITPAPTADAGPDQIVCGNNPAVNLSGAVTIATGGRWIGSGGTFVPDNNSLNAQYNPSAGEVLATFSRLILETTGNGNCLPVRDTMLVIISPAPTANAGPDQDICSNNPMTQLNGIVGNATSRVWSGGNGSFSPSTTSLNAVYMPTAAEIAAGQVTLSLTANRASCNAVTDEMVIRFTPSPTIYAGPDVSVCSNNPDVQLNGSVTVATGGIWTGGNGTFSPDANTLNAIYTPTPEEIAAGSMHLYLTSSGNGNCNPVADTMRITFTPAPEADAGAPQTVCANRSSVTLNGSVNIATGGIWSTMGTGSFTPNNATLNATYTPSDADKASGSVYLRLTTTGNGNCLPVTDSMLVTITPAPVVNAGADFDICSNNAIAQLNGSVDIATGGTWTGGNGIFTPDANSLNATYRPTGAEIANGSVTLTLVSTGNGNCNLVTDAVTIQITPAPTIDAGPDQSVCGNTSSVQLNAQRTVATGVLWTSGGTGTFSPNATTANAQYVPSAADRTNGSVVLTVTTTGNGNCTAVSDAMVITFTPVPFANAGPDQTVCTNDFPIQLNGSGTTSSWQGGTGTFTPGRNTLNPTYLPSASEISDGFVDLTLTTTENGACPAVSDVVRINLPPGPLVNAGTDQILCGDVSSVTLNGSVQNATGGVWAHNGAGSIQPASSSLTGNYVPAAADINAGPIRFVLTSTGNGACTARRDTMFLTFTQPPTVNAGNNRIICADKASIDLTGQVTVATGGTWSTSGTGNFTNPNVLSTNYNFSDQDKINGSVNLTLTSTGNGTCVPVSSTITVTITPAPTVNAGPDLTICADSGSVALTGSVTVATGGTWSTDGTGTFSPNEANLNTAYYPTAADTARKSVRFVLTSTGNGTCYAVTDTMILNITPTPVVNAGIDQVICADRKTVNLSGIVHHATGGTWSSSGTGTFSPDASNLNATYNLSRLDSLSSGVTLTLTSTGMGSCNAVMDQMFITVTPAPTVNAGSDQIVCANNPTVNLSSSVTVATGGTWSGGSGIFTPDATSLNASYQPSSSEISAGEARLVLTTTGNGTCNPVSDTLIVTITPAPEVNAGPDQTVCADADEVALSGSVTIASGGLWSTSGTGYFTPSEYDLNASYVPSIQDTANKAVTITLSSEGNGNCLAVSDALIINITSAPTVDAGNPVTVCGNNSDVQLNGVVTVATGGTWTGGTGTFSPDNNTLNTIYTPSAAEILNGSATLTLTTTGNGTCKPATDKVVVTITPAPVVNAGSDVNVCANNPVTGLNGSVTIASGGEWSNGGGTFNPGTTVMNPVYTLSDSEITNGFADLVLTSTGNGLCRPVSDTVRLNVTPSPVVNAGPDQTVCADISAVQLAGTVTNALGGSWTGTGTGTFTPNASTLNAQYTPSAGDISAGTVTLYLTSEGNGNCYAVTDTMVITITPAPTVIAGPGQIVCGNNADVQLNGAVTVATGGTWTGGGGTFSPDANTLNAVYSPSPDEISAGFVNLTLTTTGNGTCQPVSDGINIQITPAPVVNAGQDLIVCENNPVANLSGNVSVASGGIWSGGTGAFTPGDTALTGSYTLHSNEITTGSVSLILTSTGNGNCLPVSDTILITTSPAPTADAGPDEVICADKTSINLTGTVTTATGGRWTTNGSGTFTPNADLLTASYIPSDADKTNGSVTLTLTTEGNGNCLAVSDNMTLTITPAPTVNAGPDQTVCADTDGVELDGVVTVATGGAWSGGTGTFDDPGQPSTTYHLSQTDIDNGFVTLTLSSTGNGLCNAVNDQVTITITPAPTVNAGFDQTICADAGFVTLNGIVTVATGGIWSGTGTGTFVPGTGSLNVNYTPSTQDTTNRLVTFYLTTTGNGTCKAKRDTVVLTINPVPVVFAGSNKTICADAGSVELSDAYIYNATGGQWSTTGTGTFSPGASSINATYIPSANDIAAGNVTLRLTSTGMGTCNPVSSALTLTITPAPTAIAGLNDTVCANNAVVKLSGQITVATGAVWTTGSGLGTFSDNTDLNATFTPSQSQINSGIATLTLTTTGNGLCKPVTSRKFIIYKPVPLVDAGPNQTICETQSTVQLNGTATNAASGSWVTTGSGTFSNPNILNPVYTPSANDKIAGQIVLRMTSTGTGVCAPETDSLILKINPAPTVDAGPAAICSNAAGVKLDGSVTNAAGGRWTTSGSGLFSPSQNILSTNYNPSAADVTAGTVTLTLTTTGNGPCAAVSDNITLSITPVPSANAGPDQIVCANTGPVQLNGQVVGSTGGTWSSAGGGTFSPNANALNAQYTPSAADILNGKVTLTLTTIGVGLCTPASDQMEITITPAPTVNPGSPQTVCADTAGIRLNGSVTIATGGIWSSPTGGTFSPSASALNAVYTPSAADIAAGSVTLTLTTTGNGSCNPVNRTVKMTITPTPTINIGPDYTICGDVESVALNGSVTVATGRVWSASGTGTFTPDGTSQFVSYNITSQDTANGMVKLFARTTGNGMCKPVFDTATITINPAPIVRVEAGGICADKDTIQLNGVVWNAGGVAWTTSGTGTWDPDTTVLNPKYIPSGADKTAKVVTLKIFSIDHGTCNTVSDSVVINISPPPAVNAGTDITICAENTGIVLNGSVQNAAGGLWTSSGSGTFNNSTDLSATYTASAADTAARSVNLVLTTTGTGDCAAVSDTVRIDFTPAPVIDAGPAIICSNIGVVNVEGIVYNASGLEWYTVPGKSDGVFTNPSTDTVNTYTFGPQDIINGTSTIYLRSTGNGICNEKIDSIIINMASAPVADAGPNDTICADADFVTLNGSVLNAGGMIWSTLGSGSFNNPTSANAQYDPSDADTTGGMVKLVLTTTDNGLCAAVSDTMELVINPVPIVDAGPATVCSNNANVALSGTVKHAGGAVWSVKGSADGTFGNPNLLITTYTPGPNDIASKQVTIYLTSTDMGTCNPVTDSLILNITDPPAPTAGGPSLICADAGTFTLNGLIEGTATGGEWSSLGTGTFNDVTDLNAIYTLSPADTANRSVTLILTTTGNGNCNPVTDTLTVTINPAPIALAGSDQTVCADITAVPLNGTVFNATGGGWTSSGTGTFSPDTAALAATYIPSQADTANGSVTLTLTTTGIGSCIAVSDQVEITFQPAPIVDAGPASVCSNKPSINLNADIYNATGGSWTTSGDGAFAPNANTTDAIYIIGTGDTTNKVVTLTLTSTGNGACSARQDQITINITDPPAVTAGADQILCADGTITLSAAMIGANGVSWSTNGTGIWSDSTSLNPVYTPSLAEAKITADLNLWFAVTTTGTAPCDPVSDTTYVTLTPAPIAIVNAGNDTTVCADYPNIPLKGYISVASGGEWKSSGNGIFTPNAYTLDAVYMPDASDLTAGSVVLVLTTTGNGMCNPVTDTMVVSFTQRPVADAGPDQTVCEDDKTITLSGSVTNATGGIWNSSGSGTFNDNTLLTADYTVSAGDIEDSIIVLTLTTTGNGACQEAFDNKILYVRPAPIVDAGFDQEICADNRTVNLSGNLTYATTATWTSSGNGIFLPDANTLNASYQVTDQDTTAGEIKFYLTVEAADGCFAKTDSITLNITDAPTSDPGPDQVVCADVDGVRITGRVTVGSGGLWSTSGTGSFAPNPATLDVFYIPSPEDTAAGTVTLTLLTTGTGECTPVSETMDINILPVPIVNAGPDQIVCANNPGIQLAGTVYNATGGIWTGGSGTFSTNATDLAAIYTPSPSEIQAGTVTLTLTSTGMGTCKPVRDQVTFTITPAPTVDAGPDQTLCSNNPVVKLSGKVTVATGGTWSYGTGVFTPGANTLSASYTPTTAEITAREVRLVLTSTGNGKCLAVTDTTIITFTDAPVATANPVADICADKDNVQLSGSVSVATGGIWTSSGSGTFSPGSNVLSPIYSPSTSDKAAGVISLVLTTTGNGNCLSVSDTITLNITPAPTIDAGPDAVVCSNNPVVNLNASVTTAIGGTWTGSGSFNPANQLITTYTPTASEIASGSITLTVTSTGNGTCNAVKDMMTITFTPSPVANAGADQIICANNSEVLLNGSVQVATGGIWSGGSGSFIPNENRLSAKYLPSPAEIAAGSVQLTLTTTGNGSCLAVTDVVNITITPAPTVDAGGDQTVCADNNNVPLNANITIAGGAVWNTTGTGIFSPGTSSLSGTYQPSEADKTSGSIRFYLTSTANGNCLAVKDSFDLTITPAPTINAGPDQTVCANNSDVSLVGIVTTATGAVWSNGNGSYSTSASDLNTTYTPSADEISAGSVTLILTSTGNGLCQAVEDRMTIFITPAPEIDAGKDRMVCFNRSDVMLTGSVSVASGGTWSNGTGTYNPSADLLITGYAPSDAEKAAAGTTLTLTSTGNGNCHAVTDEMTITVRPAPVVNAGPDQTVCADIDEVALSGSVTVALGGTWTTTGSGIFVPNANTLNARYVPSAADRLNGNIGLTLTSTGNGNCNAVSDFMVLKITPAPTVNAGDDIEVCADAGSVALSGKVTVATGGMWTTSGDGDFISSPAVLSPEYTLTDSDIAAGRIILRLTTTGNGTCKPVSDETVLTITPAPAVFAGVDATICADAGTIALDGKVSVATGGQWNTNGTGSFGNANLLNTNYTLSSADTARGHVVLTLTTTGNGKCKAYSDSLRYTIRKAPIVSTGDERICSDLTGVGLNGIVYHATGLKWSTSGTGTFAPNEYIPAAVYTPSQEDIDSGEVILTLVSEGHGTCNAAVTEMKVTITPLPEANAGGDQIICRGASTLIAAKPVPEVTYAWFTGSGTNISNEGSIFISTSRDTTFYLSVTDQKGCTTHDEVTVFVIDPPVLNLASHFCFDEGLVMNGNPSVVPGVGSFQWYRNDTLLLNETATTYPMRRPGTHMFSYSYGSCSVYDTTSVTPLPVLSGADLLLCENENGYIRTTAYPKGSYQWYRNGLSYGSNTDSALVYGNIQYQDYVVRVTDSLGCANFDTIAVTTTPKPVLSVVDVVSCIGQTETLDGLPINYTRIAKNVKWNYEWTFEGNKIDTNRIISTTMAGTYYLHFTVGNCKASDSAEVFFNQLPEPQNSDTSKYCLRLDGEVNLDAGPATAYLWLHSNETSQVVTAEDPGYYYFQLTNEFNCHIIDSIYAKDVCPPVVYKPDAFMPNGGREEDKYFMIFGRDFANFELVIYNRWGEIIFHTTDQNVGWDGTYLGEPMPSGVYPYIIRYSAKDFEYNKGIQQEEGKVVLIR